MMTVFRLVLLVGLVLCAIATALVKKPMQAVIIYMAYSVMMSVVWILLQSPDLAITEAAVGAGITSILFFLTLIGAVMNTYMFNPTKDKYYAILLMRMNAREYTLVNYSYEILKVLVGFLVFGCILGAMVGVPIWVCVLIPFFVAGCKLFVAAWCLRDYEKTGKANNENVLGKFVWIAIALLLAAAYGLPAVGIVIPW